jgi:DNA repair protein RadC
MTQQERQAWKKRARYVYGLRLIHEGRYQEIAQRPPVRSPADAVAVLSPIAAIEPAEVFWIIALDTQHRMIGPGPIVITRGILNSSLVHPREVFRAAIVAGAAAILLAHNHPSGDPTPSVDDRAVTDQLVAAGHLLDLPVHDHLIIGANRYTSFAEAGLL